MLSTKAISISLALLVLPIASHAAPVTWNVNGKFTDGTSISGSFNYDSSLFFEEDRISDLKISTTWGYYDQNSNLLCWIQGKGFYCFKQDNSDIWIGYSSLLDPTATATFSLSEDCRSVVCNYDYRDGTGQLTSSLSAVPLPASLGMLGAVLAAFIGVGSARKRGRWRT